MTLGIVPAAGAGSRIQPLAFSKELLPVGSEADGPPSRPRAVSEYIVERMMRAGASTICFVISPAKCDILQHHAAGSDETAFVYAVQDRPRGLCDALFKALPLIRPDEPVLVGLPDTVWFPEDGLAALPGDRLSFLLFPVEQPALFDAVVTDADGSVSEIQVKEAQAKTDWVWGAFSMPGRVFLELHNLWCSRGRADEYVGTLVNAYLQEGGRAVGVPAGRIYIDVGTLDGYREAIQLLGNPPRPAAAAQPAGEGSAMIGSA